MTNMVKLLTNLAEYISRTQLLLKLPVYKIYAHIISRTQINSRIQIIIFHTAQVLKH